MIPFMQHFVKGNTLIGHNPRARRGGKRLTTERLDALAGVAQWTERRPANQRAISSIPSQGHMPGLQARSPVGVTPEATTH